MSENRQPENPPAFPSGKSEKTGFENSHPLHEGITMRDYFAAHADITGYSFQSMEVAAEFAGIEPPDGDDLVAAHKVAAAAAAKMRYILADAMLFARAATGKGVEGE